MCNLVRALYELSRFISLSAMNRKDKRTIFRVQETYGVTTFNVYDINTNDKLCVNRVQRVNKQWQSLTCFFMVLIQGLFICLDYLHVSPIYIFNENLFYGY